MNLKVVTYLNTLPKSKTPESVAKNLDKNNTLRYFIEGVNRCGDTGIVSDSMVHEPADVAVILGWVHEHGKDSPHLQLRREIVERQTQDQKRTIIADSNLFLYKDTSNPGYWLRYSYDGIFPNTGEYCDHEPDPQRWEIIQHELGVCLKDYRTTGNHILLCLQRDGGWSMGGGSVVTWALETIVELRKYSDRPIRVRAHPGDKRGIKHLERLFKLCMGRKLGHIAPSRDGSSLMDDLKDCWAVINHNSSPTVGAVIEGIPVFVTDPERSQCQDIANTKLRLIEMPDMPDRQQWVERISQFHWSHEDLRSGLCWEHMRKWAQL